ncbi:MAG TPA: hypothetical protein VMH22_08700 [bacterium]|nr:hypothetical protein [bacterium]
MIRRSLGVSFAIGLRLAVGGSGRFLPPHPTGAASCKPQASAVIIVCRALNWELEPANWSLAAKLRYALTS